MIMRIITNTLSLLFLMLVSLYGCSSQIMMPASPLVSINNDKALVTFLMSQRVPNIGPTFKFEFDIWDGDKFIGALSTQKYFQYVADPGEHLFVARGGNWSFVKATLQPGKKYYVFLNIPPRPFRLSHGVSLQPVKKEDKELMAEMPSYLNDLKPVSIATGQYDHYIKERIEEVRNEIKKCKSADCDFSILDAQDGI